MNYKLIAFDIDGTIRSVQDPVSDKTTSIINLLIDNGIIVTIATGRMFFSASLALKGLNIIHPIISYQGAHIADINTGKILWHMPLTKEMADYTLDLLKNWQVQPVFYHDGQIYVDRLTDWALGYSERNSGRVNVVGNLSEISDFSPTRIVAVGDETIIAKLEKDIASSNESRLHVTRSLPYFCEILHPSAGKHKALEWLAGYYGITRQQTVAFGNGYNDVHMLEWAGMGVAVQDSVEEIINASDKVALSMEENGPAVILEEFIAGGFFGEIK
jgi:Cof subfamily protein (haloacid dehalogenase superfamily)